MTKTTQQIVTEDRMAQRIIFELLVKHCEELTIKKAKSLSMEISVQVRNAFNQINDEGLCITDLQANDVTFWIDQIKNAGKDFNQKI